MSTLTKLDVAKGVQGLLGVTQDGRIGPQTRAALDRLAGLPDDAPWPPVAQEADVHAGKASSFADPADVAAFRRCKAQGKTDRECFKVGDNGIGYWGDDTTGPKPMCALPPEDWKPFGSKARGKLVLVKANGKEVVCELRDTMPPRAKSKQQNGAIIDLSPSAAKVLGLKPPFIVPVTWQWV